MTVTISLGLDELKALSATSSNMPFADPKFSTISTLAFHAECAAMDVRAANTSELAWKLSNMAAEIDERDADELLDIPELSRWAEMLIEDIRRIVIARQFGAA